MLSDLRKLPPDEMIDYYGRKIAELSPASSPSDKLLIELLRNLIDHNKKQVANQAVHTGCLRTDKVSNG